mgnify:CR=1 FL=1|tara:strand:- start:8687 stop:11485 length:2799 start_codon:yes stop_codon:yes gene_type:complete
MAEDITSLVLQVKSKSVGEATKALKELAPAADKAEKATDRLSKSEKDAERATGRNTKSKIGERRAQDDLNRELKEGTDRHRKYGDATTASGKSIGALVLKLGLLAAAARLVKTSVSNAAELETLEISFISLTGSAQAAKDVVEDLTNFTASTPFQLEGVASAAKQLVTARGSVAGLNGDLKTLGDISATVGVPINELAAIYTKAFNKGKVQTEELNQISERGIPIIRILAEQYGVTTAAIFKMAEQGALSFGDLETAFKKMGEEGGLAFGAMERQSQSLNGKFSTLKDNFKLATGELGGFIAEVLNLNGASDIATNSLGVIIEKVKELRSGLDLGAREGLKEDAEVQKRIIEGQEKLGFLVAVERQAHEAIFQISQKRAELEQQRQAVRVSMGGLDGQAKENALQQATSLTIQIDKLRDATRLEKAALADAMQKLLVFDQQEASLERAVQLSSRNKNEIAQISEKLKIAESLGQSISEEEKARLGSLIQQNSELAGQIDKYNQIQGAAKAAADSAAIAASATGKAFAAIESGLRTQNEIIGGQFQNRIAGIDEYKKALEEAGVLSDKEAARIDQARTRAIGDRDSDLADLIPKKRKASKRKAPVKLSEFETLVVDLRNQERAIESSYLKRLDLVRRNTKAGSKAREELEGELKAQYERESEFLAENSLNQLDISREKYASEIEQLTNFYNQRKQIIIDSEVLTEQEKNAAVAKLEKERGDIQKKTEIERWKQSLDTTQDFLTDIEAASKLFGKRGAKIAKAAAIANATIDTARNAILAYQRGLEIPVIGAYVAPVFAAAAIAAGAAQIATIKSQSVGNYATGGIVPGSSFAGDNLTANVNSAEMILNRQQQARLFDIANGRGQQSGGNVTIINQTSSPVEAESRVNANGDREIIIREAVKRTKAELTNEANTGAGSVVPAMQRNFGLRRTGT